MAGIAGMIDLTGARPVPRAALASMARALAHRGPDGEQLHEAAGVGLAYRHLDTGLRPCDGLAVRGELAVVCQAHLTDDPSTSAAERIAQLGEAHGTGLFDHLRGTFAFALWDGRSRRLLLGRDRFGMAPLYWSRQGDWLLFASEIKGLFAGALVRAAVDRWGIDHVFTFLGMPAARTCFRDVQALPPGHYLEARDGRVEVRRYWDLDFPNRGQEEDGNAGALTDRLEDALRKAVARRLGPDERVASYVSGGIDCSTVAALAALAALARAAPVPTLTVRLASPEHDESPRARRAARAGGSEPVVVDCGPEEVVAGYPGLVRAAESPVPDPSCVALMVLAARARAEGHRVALTGDGADDLFAGYPWFKVHRVMGLLDWLPGLRPSQWLRRLYLRLTAPHVPWANVRRIQGLVGGHHAWLDLYGLVALNRPRFYSAAMREALAGRFAHEDLALDLDRMKRWHPLNQGLYLGMKVHVPGLLLQAKGDRIAARAGVELRQPFLDEEVVALAARLHPRWKLRWLRDKYLLRHVAARHLPADIAWRPKADFIAPFDALYGPDAPAWAEQLLAEPALRHTGYFDPAAVARWRREYRSVRRRTARVSVEVGLAGVVATQLWHHTFLERLADVPGTIP